MAAYATLTIGFSLLLRVVIVMNSNVLLLYKKGPEEKQTNKQTNKQKNKGKMQQQQQQQEILSCPDL